MSVLEMSRRADHDGRPRLLLGSTIAVKILPQRKQNRLLRPLDRKINVAEPDVAYARGAVWLKWASTAFA
jgi:hypothetical protein